jgi:hypothetical protein
MDPNTTDAMSQFMAAIRGNQQPDLTAPATGEAPAEGGDMGGMGGMEMPEAPEEVTDMPTGEAPAGAIEEPSGPDGDVAGTADGEPGEKPGEGEEGGEVDPEIAEFIADLAANPAEAASKLRMLLNSHSQQTYDQVVIGMRDMVQNLLQAEVSAMDMRYKFFSQHPDLVPHETLLKSVTEDLMHKNPGMSPDEMLAAIADTARKELNMSQTPKPSMPEQGGAVGQSSGSGGPISEADRQANMMGAMLGNRRR